ncbi:hypothetical protein [Novosphingobium cyanobacteriorum]|uniref:Lipoprotein n=1 Tax=Novosphingobium cyanobacteriorum TaxID=3024215 RepID=A0ABT6CER2_9SPHN|nr:hypothetical protein [Novosphingobium cyanobacteriorum]MDF8332414.1 hypothetical protein [Novosphingobium cyanobacteriorum]
MRWKGLFLIPLLASCDPTPHIGSDDISAILRIGIETASAKLGPDTCIVTAIGRRFPPIPGEDKEEIKWQEDGTLRYRLLRFEAPKAIPETIIARKKVTLELFGCSRTIEFLQPEMVEIDDQGRRGVSAELYLNHLCGPICGEQYVIDFARTKDGWSAKPDSFRPSGVSF